MLIAPHHHTPTMISHGTAYSCDGARYARWSCSAGVATHTYGEKNDTDHREHGSTTGRLELAWSGTP